MSANDTREAISLMIAETTALNAAVSAADGPGSAEEASRLARDILAARRPLTSDPIQQTAEMAMQLIAGETVVLTTLPRGSGAVVATCAAWRLLGHSHREAATRVQDVLSVLKGEKSDGIESMAVRYWAQAIGRMAAGDSDDARRLWRRAIELATNFGTETSQVISWTYAASFRHQA